MYLISEICKLAHYTLGGILMAVFSSHTWGKEICDSIIKVIGVGSVTRYFPQVSTRIHQLVNPVLQNLSNSHLSEFVNASLEVVHLWFDLGSCAVFCATRAVHSGGRIWYMRERERTKHPCSFIDKSMFVWDDPLQAC